MLIWCSLILMTHRSFAQFYYQDVVNNRNNHEQFLRMKKEKVTRVNVRSFESSGEPTEGFLMEQNFNNSYTQLKTTTRLPGSKTPSVMINYYNQQGLLYRTVDSSEASVSAYEYGYDSSGRLVSVSNSSKSQEDKIRSTELHLWSYNDRGYPEKMLRIREGSDTMEIRLNTDNRGLVTEETTFRKNQETGKVYYYYNEEGRLSDIVRFQEKLGRMIPDYTFDYNADGSLAEMMVVQQSGKDYLVWKYEYTPNGLKKKESCFTRQKRLAGSVEYSYEMKK